jgi:hypothetical protein
MTVNVYALVPLVPGSFPQDFAGYRARLKSRHVPLPCPLCDRLKTNVQTKTCSPIK